MKAALGTIAGAVMFGLAGGYAWSAMAPAEPTRVRLPKATMLIPADAPQSADDKAWAARANEPTPTEVEGRRADPTVVEASVHYSGCNEVRAAGKAPLYAGQPGYRSDMDGDNDGIACEPHRTR
jgi:hypothetical protein